MGRRGTERYWEVDIIWEAGVHGKKVWTLTIFTRSVFPKWQARRAVRKRCKGARVLRMRRMFNMDGGGFDGAIDAEALLR